MPDRRAFCELSRRIPWLNSSHLPKCAPLKQAAIASGAVTGLELMERAGRGVVEAVFAEWPELAPAAGAGAGAARTPERPGGSPQGSPADEIPQRFRREGPAYPGQEERARRAVVLCGPGNNGGDGFVVARLLAGLGWSVEVYLYGDPGKLPPDARVNFDKWTTIGQVASWNDTAIEDLLDAGDHDLVIDALFGTGLTRPMPPDTERCWHGFVPTVFSRPAERRQKYVAVDMPSGICSDSGRNLEGALPADLTVTFHRAKLGHYLSPMGPPQGGALWSGKVVVVDIGLTDADAVGVLGGERPVELVTRPAPRTDKGAAKPGGHKYVHGHALVLAGPSGRGGAARLAARGALRVGAGLVTLGPPHAALAENAAQLTAVMLTEVDDGATLARVLADGRLNALALGPGLGIERARDLVPVALEAGRATVLDADALTAFAHDPPTLFAMLHGNCVLTPHAGEFSRLFPDIAEALAKPATRGPAYSKVDATRAAAKRAGCTVLFKGPDTVIADPSGGCAINAAAFDRAAPWLATAGSGDVLAGFITGLLARGFGPMEAAETAAWLHVEAALGFGPGLIAEDLPEQMPKVFRDLGL